MKTHTDMHTYTQTHTHAHSKDHWSTRGCSGNSARWHILTGITSIYTPCTRCVRQCLCAREQQSVQMSWHISGGLFWCVINLPLCVCGCACASFGKMTRPFSPHKQSTALHFVQNLIACSLAAFCVWVCASPCSKLHWIMLARHENNMLRGKYSWWPQIHHVQKNRKWSTVHTVLTIYNVLPLKSEHRGHCWESHSATLI